MLLRDERSENLQNKILCAWERHTDQGYYFSSVNMPVAASFCLLTMCFCVYKHTAVLVIIDRSQIIVFLSLASIPMDRLESIGSNQSKRISLSSIRRMISRFVNCISTHSILNSKMDNALWLWMLFPKYFLRRQTTMQTVIEAFVKNVYNYVPNSSKQKRKLNLCENYYMQSQRNWLKLERKSAERKNK